MPSLAPSADLRFAADGTHETADALPGVLDTLATAEVTDLLVLSHGWRNDASQASAMYDELLANVATQAPGSPAAGARLGALRVYWPAKPFRRPAAWRPDPAASGEGRPTAVDGGAGDELEALAEAVRALRADLEPSLSPDQLAALDAAARAATRLTRDSSYQDAFAASLLEIVPSQDDEDAVAILDPRDVTGHPGGRPLLERIAPAGPLQGPGPGPAAGGPVRHGGGIARILGGAWELLNYATFWPMKARSGVIGEAGLYPVLRQVRERFPEGTLRLHLVGHSLGARVVSVAAAAAPPVGVDSMTLLQGALSHYSFSSNYADSDRDAAAGRFHPVLAEGRVRGPIVVTHTRNDSAVGTAYALASRAAGQIAQAVGDEDDPFGGLGSNGAQRTPVDPTETRLKAAGAAYDFTPGALHNLQADDHIADHGDVRNEAVASALLAAIAAVPR